MLVSSPVANRMRPPEAPALPVRALHLAVVWTFAVVQPLFQVLGGEFFFDVLPRDAVIFALALTVVPPAILSVAEALAGLISKTLSWFLHLTFMCVLAAIFASQLLRTTIHVSGDPRFVLAIMAGVGFAALYGAAGPVRMFMTVLSAGVPVVLALFLFASPTSHFMLSSENDGPYNAPQARTPVVVLLFDEVPATSLMDASGHVDARRYPNFAQLERSATWFPNATTVHDSTVQAVPAILSGKRSEKASFPIGADHPDNIFTFLGGSYRVHASETETDLCPERLCPRSTDVSFPRRMWALVRQAAAGAALQSLPRRLATRWFPVVIRGFDSPARTAQFMKGITAGRPPSLDLLHLLLPHQPWRYLPSGKTYPPAESDAEVLDAFRGVARWPRDPGLALHSYERHLLQLAYADHLLGKLLQRLRAVGKYDKALVVVMADHGVSFRAGGRPRLGDRRNAEDILSMPLFVKRPGQRRGRISARFVRTVDVLPTIAATLHVRLPFRVDGESVFERRYPSRTTVGLTNRIGGGVTLTTRDFLRRRRLALRRQVRLFGSRSLARLYWLGSNADLLGRRLADLRIRTAVRAHAELEAPGSLSSVDRRSPQIPTRVEGRLSGPPAEPGTQIAVALNGRLVAATRAFPTRSGLRFAAMVPETSLRQGRNHVGVVAVVGRGSRRRLELVRL
jgi:hypothetical protein